MAIVNVREARNQLSRLIRKAQAGEEVVITRNKLAVVKLVPVTPRRRRVPGRLAGAISIDDRFFEPLPDNELAAWSAG